MAARPHGADEPREGPIDEPFDEGGPEHAPGRSVHREEPHATGSSESAEGDEPSGDDGSLDPGSAPADEPGRQEAAAPPDDGTAAADVPPGAPGGPAGRPHDETEDVDARWQEIIAQLADLDSDAPATGRGDPGAGPDAGAGRAPTTDPTAARTVRPAAPASSHRSWSPDPAVEEAEDHFEPPDPGPVLGGDPLLTMAWAVVVGVPVLFIAAVVLWRDIPTVVLRSAAVAFVAGVGLLLWRMPHRRDEDDGPGAVV